MAPECPNCRCVVPRMRLFFTPAWGRWRCPGCGALLKVNITLRLLVIAFAGFAPLLLISAMRSTPLYISGPAALALVIVVVLLIDQPALDRPAGFHCRQCGYNLEGQEQPRCPECGAPFDHDTLARLHPHQTPEPLPPAPRHPWVMVLFAGLIILLTASFIGGLVLALR